MVERIKSDIRSKEVVQKHSQLVDVKESKMFKNKFVAFVFKVLGGIFAVGLLIVAVFLLNNVLTSRTAVQTGQSPTPTVELNEKVYLPIVTKGDDQPSPTPDPDDPTVGWLTYRNDELGFSINYPPELVYLDYQDLASYPQITFYYKKYTGVYYAPVIAINFYPKENLSLNQWVDNRRAKSIGSIAEIKEVKAYRQKLLQSNAQIQTNAISYVKDISYYKSKLYSRVIDKGDWFMVMFYSENENYKDINLEPIFTQMLATLEFTD